MSIVTSPRTRAVPCVLQAGLAALLLACSSTPPPRAPEGSGAEASAESLRERDALSLLDQARAEAEADRSRAAYDSARAVLERFPDTRASGPAALLASRMALALGRSAEAAGLAASALEHGLAPAEAETARTVKAEAEARERTRQDSLAARRAAAEARQDSLEAARRQAVEVARRDSLAFARRRRERAAGRDSVGAGMRSEAGDTVGRAPDPLGRRALSMNEVVERARARMEAGDPAGALQTLTDFTDGSDPGALLRGLDLARSAASRTSREELASLLRATPLGWPLIAPVQVAYARSLHLAGERGQARRYAEAALALGAVGEDASAARAILSSTEVGEPEGGEAHVSVGVLLPGSGSPAVQRYATAIREGVETALSLPDAPAGVDLQVRDDEGDPGAAAAQLRALEAGPLVGVVGPLQSDALRAAAEARSTPVVLVSPTAPDAGGLDGAYSLGAPDPGAARALARYALESGLEQVVVIHPGESRWAYEARAFGEIFRELGGSVLRTLSYAPGATYFQEQLRQAEALRPQALVLPVPSRDIEALAPQVSFFGLDTLGIRVLGTADWSDEALRRDVAARHMNGVVIATPQRPGPESEGHRRFRRSYEEHFQRTLRDDLASLGYDAASLLLLGIRSGARTPEDLRRAMEEIRDFEGASGTLSIEDGQIVRRHYLVCVQDGGLVDIRPGELPVQVRPTRRGDPEKGEPERVPLGPVERYCPGHVPAEVRDTLPGVRVGG